MTDIHPNEVLEALKKKARRSNKIRNLEIVHAACNEVFDHGGTDYSKATIGRMAEQRGGPAAQTLYNTASEDYSTLIDSWASHYRRKANRTPALPTRATEDVALRTIVDPAARAMLGIALAERDKYRDQLNTLKSQSNLAIDLRPLPGLANVNSVTGQVLQVISPLEDLTPAELEALAHAVSSSFLKNRGWSEGPNGEIVDLHGHRVFRAGFAPAIRKVLSAAPIANTGRSDPRRQ